MERGAITDSARVTAKLEVVTSGLATIHPESVRRAAERTLTSPGRHFYGLSVDGEVGAD